MTPFVTPRLVLMLVLSYMAFDTTLGEFCAVNSLMICHEEFIYSIGLSFDVLRLDAFTMGRVCNSPKARDSCSEKVLQSKNCLKPPELNGVAEAISFICDNYNEDPSRNVYNMDYRICFNEMPRLNCTGMYPQVMPMAARHILDKVETFLDMTYSDSTESHILTGACIHLSTNRDIFCSASFLEMKCETNAARWHSTLKYRLFNMTPDHLSQVYFRGRNSALTVIDLEKCSSLGDAKIIATCELMHQCVPLLNKFAKSVVFGVFTFEDPDLELFCSTSQKDLQTCVSKVVPHCSLIDVFIYNGSLKVHEKLCTVSHKALHLRYSTCLKRIRNDRSFGTVISCADELMEKFKSVSLSSSTSDEHSVETTLCNAAATYLACLEEKLKALCGPEAALWQRKMTRYMIVQAFQLTYCSSTFDFSDMDKSVEGQGPALKFDELKTALLVVSATVVTCSNYIKRLYQV